MEVLLMTLREKLMHYTHDLDCGADLKQEAIAAIESIAQYMDEDELLHHSRPLALAYLALTEDASVPVVRCKDCKHLFGTLCTVCGLLSRKPKDFCSYGERKDGADAKR
jgi:hypothetical protein